MKLIEKQIVQEINDWINELEDACRGDCFLYDCNDNYIGDYDYAQGYTRIKLLKQILELIDRKEVP